MPVRFLVRLLFGLALLAQASSAWSARFATAASESAQISALCATLHDHGDKPGAATPGSEHSPQNGSPHHHCSYCQIGSGAPPLRPHAPHETGVRFSWTCPVFEIPRAPVIVARANHNAPARAPPSLS